MLCVLHENTRECLAIEVGRSLRSQDVILTLSRLMRINGKPAFIRSDKGAEFTATAVMKWLRDQSIGLAYIKPGSSVAERLRRELQRHAAGRVFEPSVVCQPPRSQADR